MIELGESSILRVAPPAWMPVYEPSKRRLTWANGTTATVFSGDEPDQLRGPQHDKVWIDELAKFKYPTETWEGVKFGLRIGAQPQVLITTTPRPIKVIRDIISRPSTVDIRRSSRENFANLSPVYMTEVIEPLDGTRLGRQEIDGEILEDTPGALWTLAQIDAGRVAIMPELTYVVVSVDPAATSADTSDEAGIVVAGKDAGRHGYTLGDYTRRGTPMQWATEAVSAFHRHKANMIVAEANNGGEMVSTIIRSVDPSVPVKLVWAAEGKRTRAEPVSMLYEQGKAHHAGTFAALEDEMTSWVPLEGRSPNRIDALVWAYHELGLTGSGKAGF